MPYSDEEKCDIVRIFYKNNNNANAAREAYRRTFPLRAIPAKNTFKNIERAFRIRKTLRRKRRTVLVDPEEELHILLYFEGR